MLINLSNHPSSKWGEKQLEAARVYGRIVDLPFPQINPSATDEEVSKIVKECLYDANDIDIHNRCQYDFDDGVTVHVMGEMGFVYNFVNRSVYDCIYSTTERKSVETTDVEGKTTKTMVFEFVQFRTYRK